MTTISWLLTLVASSSVVGLLFRHFTTKSIEHAFGLHLESVKHKHQLEIKKLEEDNKRTLEGIKANIAHDASISGHLSEIEKVKYMEAARARATSLPALVSLLRRIRLIFEDLHRATAGMHGQPIDMIKSNKRRIALIKSFDDLAAHIKEFQDELSSVRLFLLRSTYSLPSFAYECLSEWQAGIGSTETFVVTFSTLNQAYLHYKDDVSDIADRFYEPFSPQETRPSFNLFHDMLDDPLRRPSTNIPLQNP
jgi:hypothetical protein